MSNSNGEMLRNKNSQPSNNFEPIAIIGIGCRFPGQASDAKGFWKLLHDGVDAISEVPPDRWSRETFFDPDPAARGRTYARWGGFIDQIDQFDAGFFEISPREAAFMDPQQRLLLEVSWEALEDAGQVPERLSGSKAGVFIGISTHDFGDIQTRNLYNTDFYANTGGALSIAANRLSYFYNFCGPSLAVDTACSSSLVAVHLACRSLRDKECELAIVGGVNCIITPETTITFSKGAMLSPDGRSKAFDEGANGYVRGEGCGVIVLKPLSQAEADGDPIYAVIMGTAVNQDGRTQGMTVPNLSSQQALLREAYQQAGISAQDVLYIEAHGTGTPVGDPIEANAIGSVLGVPRPAGDYLRIGSTKSNIGHLEAASGIAGLIKGSLMLHHRELPASLHLVKPNPNIRFEELRLKVQDKFETFPETENLPVIGVNSFGFGGTNAHVVMTGYHTAADHRTQSETSAPKDYLIPLSARSPEALVVLGRAYKDFLTDGEPGQSAQLADICYSTSLRRGHHKYRVGLVVNSKEELISALDSLSTESISQVSAAKLVFVCSGMGPQWWGMGRELLRHEPVFRSTIEKYDALFRRCAGWSLLEQLTVAEAESRMEETEVAQPTNFALQMGLAALWNSWGILPDAVVGHSAGEVAAAAIAGALSPEDAVSVIFHRSRLQQMATGKGSMLAAGLSEAQTKEILSEYGDRVSLAAVNSPTSVTLSGDTEALQEVARTLSAKEVFCRLLEVKVPYHSHHMDPLKSELLASLEKIQPRPASIPLYSTVTGKRVDGSEIDGSYWWSNIRDQVNFLPALEELLKDGYKTFLEFSPHPVLARSILEILAQRKETGTVLNSLHRDKEQRALREALGSLYETGRTIDWKAVAPPEGAYVPLPKYQWQKERHWNESDSSARHRLADLIHPLLERQIVAANATWETNLTLSVLRYLEDHRVQGSIVYPGAAYVEMALAAAHKLDGNGPIALEDVEFKRALVLRKGEDQQIQFTFDDQQQFRIHSRSSAGDQAWTLHALGSVQTKTAFPEAKRAKLEKLKDRCKTERNQEFVYQMLEAKGLQYGECFQGIQKLWQGKREAVGRIQVDLPANGEPNGYHLHPAVLDAAFQVLMGAIFNEANVQEQKGTYLPVKIARVLFRKRPSGGVLWSHAQLVNQDSTGLEGNVVIFDENGDVVAEFLGFKCQHLSDQTTRDDWTRHLYELQWFAKRLPGVSAEAQGRRLPAPSQIISAVPEAEALSSQFDRNRHYGEVEPQLETLCAAYAWEALIQLGWKPERGKVESLSDLAEHLGVLPQHHKLLNRLLEILSEEGRLRQTNAGWETCGTRAFEPTEQTWDALLKSFPDYEAVLALLGRCGSNLATVLRGEQDPLQLIFPEVSMSDLQQSYEESAYNRVYNYLVAQVVSSIVKTLPANQTIRVLEVGAGTGGTTAHVLPVLPPHRTEYVFTDVSNVFTTFGSKRFSGYPFVEHRLLDIERSPESQGIAPHSFDLVLGTNVLHATRDLGTTLENIRELLTPGGLLVFMEFNRASRVLDLVFGLLKDWWRFEDVALRGSHPWISRQAWENLLREKQFVDVGSVSDTSDSAEPFQAVFVAQNPYVDAEAKVGIEVEAPAEGQWLILADRGELGLELAENLRARGNVPLLVTRGTAYAAVEPGKFEVRPDDPADMNAVLESITGELKGVVHLWSLDIPSVEEAGADAVKAGEQLGCISALNLVQALARSGRLGQPRLWLVTRGAQELPADSDSISLAQAPAWGLGRVIANEQSDLRCTLLDLDPSGAGASEMLLQEILANDVEQEIGFRGGARYAARVVRPETLSITSTPAKTKTTRNGKTSPYYLQASKPGILDSLLLQETVRRKPRPNEVEIQVEAAGLNFRDVMKAMGMYPTEHASELWLGDECAGRIVRTGSGVNTHKVGDEVVAIGPGTFGKFVTVPSDYVFAKPKHLSFAEAATIPIVFLTTHYALNHLARLAAGERVLIHSAAGGVGLAALQFAQNKSAEIFATAGSPQKREYVKSLGVSHVMDSRSQAFAETIRKTTGGKGVAVVLNSLSGEFIRNGLSILEPTGRFLELGKIDIYQGSKLSLGQFKKGLSFFAIDLGWLLQNRPEYAQLLFKEVMAMFEAQTLRPLPVKTFPVSDAANAFRYMAQGKHIGKIALSFEEHAPAVVTKAPAPQRLVRTNATYVITGGLGGFGLAMGEWLVGQGARHLVLVGRSGTVNGDAEQTLARMRQAGAEVRIAKVDVTQRAQVQRLVEEIDSSGAPLRGIIHAAMVLDDGYLSQLDQKRFERVMAPKVTGAWNFHVATLNKRLDFFINFSSISSLTGAAGQGNYSAANAFLDGFAHYRKAKNLNALTVNWGAIANVGYVARNADIGRYLERQGLEGLTPVEAGRILGQLLRGNRCQVGVIKADFQKLASFYNSPAASRRFSHVLHQEACNADTANTQAQEQGELLKKIREAKPEEQFELAESLVRKAIASVLKTPASKIEADQPLARLGLDSLMAVELELRVETELGIDLSFGFLAGGEITMKQLTAKLLEQLVENKPAEKAMAAF